jgi:hypothetical protein
MLSIFFIILQITILAYAFVGGVFLAFSDFVVPLKWSSQMPGQPLPEPTPTGFRSRQTLSSSRS